VAVGFLVYLVAAVAGIATVFSHVPVAYTALKVAGAAYLLHLAWQAVRPGATAVFALRGLPVDGPRRLFVMGLVTNLLNPKIAVLYVSLLPQFIDPHSGSVALQSLALGSIQITIALSVNCLIVLTAGSLALFLGRHPGWLRTQRYLMGTVLCALAVRLATRKEPNRGGRLTPAHLTPAPVSGSWPRISTSMHRRHALGQQDSRPRRGHRPGQFLQEAWDAEHLQKVYTPEIVRSPVFAVTKAKNEAPRSSRSRCRCR